MISRRRLWWILRVLWCELVGHKWGKPQRSRAWFIDKFGMLQESTSIYADKIECDRCGAISSMGPRYHPRCRCSEIPAREML